MKGTIVTSSRAAAVVVVAFVLIAPLAAQQVAPSQAAADSVDTQARNQIRLYEIALKAAVLNAGAQLADRASRIVPGVQLAPQTDPVVRFVPTPEGPVFDVQIPLLLDAGPVIMRMLQNQRPAPQSAAIPVAQPQDRVTSSGVVTADPMTKSPVQAENFDPDHEYTEFARNALIDALLDNSAAVPLKEGQRLEIAASGLEIGRGPLYPDNSKKLMLVISAADLLEFRQGKITRDEAKARIKEGKY
jgi:hypothetical protein